MKGNILPPFWEESADFFFLMKQADVFWLQQCNVYHFCVTTTILFRHLLFQNVINVITLTAVYTTVYQLLEAISFTMQCGIMKVRGMFFKNLNSVYFIHNHYFSDSLSYCKTNCQKILSEKSKDNRRSYESITEYCKGKDNNEKKYLIDSELPFWQFW